jgi:flavin-dependent dehydrogenase
MSAPIVILGAGPAGSAAALTLRRYLPEQRVVLVERHAAPLPGTAPSESMGAPGEARPVRGPGLPSVGETLSPGVLPLLGYLGLRDLFLREGHLPAAGTSSAWGSEQVLQRHYLFTGRGQGWHVDRTRFDTWLQAQAEAAGVSVLRGELREAERTETGFTLDLGGTSVHASALIDATGRSARLARHLGASVLAEDSLMARARWFTVREPEQTAEGALIESVPEGWWYSATLPGGRAVQMLMSDVMTFRAETTDLDGFWQRCLDRAPATRERTRGWQATGEEVVRPAHSQRTTPVSGHRWVAAGDAAAAFDPLASMGIGFALRSGMEAARVAAASVEEEEAARGAYTQSLEGIYRDYLDRLRRLYALETRWNQPGFWQRRRPF